MEFDWKTIMDTATSEAKRGFDWMMTSGADWTIWVVVALGLFLGLRFLRALIAGTFKSSKASSTSIRNIIGNLVGATSSLFLIIFSFSVTAPFLIELSDKYAAMLAGAMTVATILQIAFFARVVVRAFMDGVVAKTAEDSATFNSARNLIAIFVNFAIFAIAGVMIIDNLGGDVTGLIAGLGVGGIAIGLAAQNIFKALFASLSIILDKPFVNGDFVIFDGGTGTIEKIGLKTTRIRALSGEQLVIGNDQLLSKEIHNYKRMAERRIVFKLGVEYSTPREVLEQIPGRIKSIVESREMCRFDRSHMSGYGDFAIMFETVYYVLAPDYAIFMDEQQAIYLDIHKAFEELGAVFAFPTQTIHVQGIGGANPDAS